MTTNRQIQPSTPRRPGGPKKLPRPIQDAPGAPTTLQHVPNTQKRSPNEALHGPREPSTLPLRGPREAPPHDPNRHPQTYCFFQSRPTAPTSNACQYEATFLGPRTAPVSDTSLFSSCFSVMLVRALPSCRHSRAFLGSRTEIPSHSPRQFPRRPTDAHKRIPRGLQGPP